MVESIAELREICQGSKKALKEEGPYGLLFRKITIYFTWLFLHTPITANQVTLLSIIVGVAGALLLASTSRSLLLLAPVLLHLYYILDGVDGEIARYRQGPNSGSGGRFLDWLTHFIIFTWIFFWLGVGVYRELRYPWAIVLGFLGSFGISHFPWSCKEHVLIAILREQPDNVSEPLFRRLMEDRIPAQEGRLCKVRFLVSQLVFYPGPIVYSSIAAVLDAVLPPLSLGFVLLSYRLLPLIILVPVFLLHQSRQVVRHFKALEKVNVPSSPTDHLC